MEDGLMDLQQEENNEVDCILKQLQIVRHRHM